MERPSISVIIVVLLLGVLFLREPRFQRSEEIFLRWLLRHSQPAAKPVPLTIVELGKENPPPPLETALLLARTSRIQTDRCCVEPVLQWGERAKDQEQIFMDQAMRVPRLFSARSSPTSPDPDAPVSRNYWFHSCHRPPRRSSGLFGYRTSAERRCAASFHVWDSLIFRRKRPTVSMFRCFFNIAAK